MEYSKNEVINDNFYDEYEEGIIQNIYQTINKDSDYGNIFFYEDFNGDYHCLIETSDILTNNIEEVKNFINTMTNCDIK